MRIRKGRNGLESAYDRSRPRLIICNRLDRFSDQIAETSIGASDSIDSYGIFCHHSGPFG